MQAVIFYLLSSGVETESIVELYLEIGLEADGLSGSMAVMKFKVVNQNLIWFCQRRKLLPSNFSDFVEKISLVPIIWWCQSNFVIIMFHTRLKFHPEHKHASMMESLWQYDIDIIIDR